MNNCTKCGLPSANPKFCCRSCAASYNNKKNPKRKPEHKCKICQSPMTAGRKFCTKCSIKNKDITLSEAMYTKHHKSSAFALVRSRARKLARSLNWTTCQNCKYNKHIEIAHKQSISKFSESTLLSVINKPDNLIPLCRNCHWEFDHGILKI